MKRRAFLTLQLLLSLALAACSTAQPYHASRPSWNGRPVDNRTDFAVRLLTNQNRERTRLGLVPFRWSASLAANAGKRVETLAASNSLEHSDSGDSASEGENLWMGTAGAYLLEEMIGDFVGERKDFRPGIFDEVSKSGNWESVGHYTQIIWPATREVGCALATRGRTDWLVCRYAPAGNVVGQPVG